MTDVSLRTSGTVASRRTARSRKLTRPRALERCQRSSAARRHVNVAARARPRAASSSASPRSRRSRVTAAARSEVGAGRRGELRHRRPRVLPTRSSRRQERLAASPPAPAIRSLHETTEKRSMRRRRRAPRGRPGRPTPEKRSASPTPSARARADSSSPSGDRLAGTTATTSGTSRLISGRASTRAPTFLCEQCGDGQHDRPGADAEPRPQLGRASDRLPTRSQAHAGQRRSAPRAGRCPQRSPTERLGVRDDTVGTAGRGKDQRRQESGGERHRTRLAQPGHVGDGDDARGTHPERCGQCNALQNLAAVAVCQRAEEKRLAQGPSTALAEHPMADELDIRSPRLRPEQLAPELVDEDRDPQLGPHLQERRIEPTDVGLDPAHPRLEEDCVDAEMAEQRGLGRHCRAMVRLGSSLVPAITPARDRVGA